MPEASSDKAAEKEVRRLRQLPENLTCPNCLKESEHGFGAICVPFKTFICDDCKSAHQSFSHRTKSVAGSFWKMEEVKALDERNGGGNAMARKTWLGTVPEGARPGPDAALEAKKRFVQKVYEDRRWLVAAEDAVRDDGLKEGGKEGAAGPGSSGTESVGGHSRRSRQDAEDREERRARRAARREAKARTEEMGQVPAAPASVQSQINWAPDTFAAPDALGFEAAGILAPDASSHGWGTDRDGHSDASPASWAYPSRPVFDTFALQPAVDVRSRPRLNTDPTNPWAAEVEARMREQPGQRRCGSDSIHCQIADPSNPWAPIIRSRVESASSGFASSIAGNQGGQSQLLGQPPNHRGLWNVTACA